VCYSLWYNAPTMLLAIAFHCDLLHIDSSTTDWPTPLGRTQ